MSKILFTGFLFFGLLQTVVFGEIKRQVYASSGAEEGEGKKVLREVQFVHGSELSELGFGKGKVGKTYAIVWFSESNAAVVELTKPSGTVVGAAHCDLVDFLALFMPTGKVEGTQVNGAKRQWRFAAPWPGDAKAVRLARRLELAAAEKNERLTSAEMKMVQGDKEGAMRHLRFAKRDFFRQKERVQSSRVDVLISIVD